MAVEIKCPVPGKTYTIDVHYDIPHLSADNSNLIYALYIYLLDEDMKKHTGIK